MLILLDNQNPRFDVYLSDDGVKNMNVNWPTILHVQEKKFKVSDVRIANVILILFIFLILLMLNLHA